jgi:sulfonate dioxygenase
LVRQHSLLLRSIQTLTTLPEYSDPGLLADPSKPNLLAPSTKLRHLSPYLGTELSGIQLSSLSSAGLNELALYTAERKVLVFRDQDFKDLTPERQIAIARHFGPIQRHPTSGNVKGYPEFHVVYRDAERDRVVSYRNFGEKVKWTSWHSDVTYEKQTPGTTFFFILDQVCGPPFPCLFLSLIMHSCPLFL